MSYPTFRVKVIIETEYNYQNKVGIGTIEHIETNLKCNTEIEAYRIALSSLRERFRHLENELQRDLSY